MTGGRAIILGPSGRNFAAGMSGGIAFMLDQHNTFRSKCNMESVDILSVEKRGRFNLVIRHTNRLPEQNWINDRCWSTGGLAC